MTDLKELIQYWQMVLEVETGLLSDRMRDRIEETIMFLEKLKQTEEE